MIPAAQKDEAFLADVRSVPSSPDELKIWWLGQSGFLLRCAGATALLDPYLSDSLTRKYAATAKPHVRMTERVIAPERMSAIDVITSSHDHTDHFDPETLLPILRENPDARLIVPEANRGLAAERLGVPPENLLGLVQGLEADIGGFTFIGIPAAHDEIEQDDRGYCRYLGYVIRRGPWTIYHSGDTLLYSGLVESLSRFEIDVALLPINGNRPERRVAGNLDGSEAAQLAQAIGARCVVPCHYDLFEFNTANPADLFIPECERLGQPFRVLRGGEGFRVQ